MTFKLGDELFAIDVSQVREVLEVAHITTRAHRARLHARAW